MNLGIPSLSRVRGLQGGEDIAAALLELQAGIVAGWETNHNADGQHTTIYSAAGIFTALGQPRVRLYKRSTQTITSGVDTYLTWERSQGSATDAEEYDTASQFNGIDAVVCTAPGLYLVSTLVGWDGSALGSRYVSIATDRAVGATATSRQSGDATASRTQYAACPVFVPTGTVDTIRIQVFQDSGTNRTISGWFAVIKVS